MSCAMQHMSLVSRLIDQNSTVVLPSLSADQFATSVLTQSQLRVKHHLAFHKGCQDFAVQGQAGVGRARILVLHESKRCVSQAFWVPYLQGNTKLPNE